MPEPSPSEPGGLLPRPKQPSGAVLGLAVVGAVIFTQLLSTINGVLAARMLGVEGRGEVVLVASLATMASQLTLGGGLPNALTKLLADRGFTARDGLSHLFGKLVLISLVPSVVAAGYLLFLERHDSGATKYGLAVALVLMALQTMGMSVMIGAMLGEGTPMVSFVVTNLAPQVVTTLAFVFFFAIGAKLDVLQTLGLVIGSALLTAGFRLFALRKPTRNPEHRLHGREIWSLTKKTYVGSVGPIDGLSIDRTLVGSLLGSVQLGLYSAAFSLASLTNILGGTLAMIMLPRVATSQHDPERERYVVRVWFLGSVVLVMGSVVFLEVVAGPTIRLAFGDDFTPATSCARWLIAAGGLLSLRRVLIAVLQGRGRGGWASWIELALTPLMILGVWLSAERHSLVGTGMTMFAVGGISCVLLGIAAHRSRPGGGHHVSDLAGAELPATT